MARWLPFLAWCSCAISLTLIVVLNCAGTSVHHNQHHDSGDGVVLGDYAFFSVILPFNSSQSADVYPTFSWTVGFYLNNACVFPTRLISGDIGPICLSPHIGRSLSLAPLIEEAVLSTSSWEGFHPNATLANVHMRDVGGMVVPFVFYLLAVGELAVLLVSVLLVYCVGHFALWFHLALMGSAALNIVIASAILIALARNRSSELEGNSSRPYVEDATVMPGFNGACWGGFAGLLVAAALLLCDWRWDIKLSGRGLRRVVRARPRTTASRRLMANDVRMGDTVRLSADPTRPEQRPLG